MRYGRWSLVAIACVVAVVVPLAWAIAHAQTARAGKGAPKKGMARHRSGSDPMQELRGPERLERFLEEQMDRVRADDTAARERNRHNLEVESTSLQRDAAKTSDDNVGAVRRLRLAGLEQSLGSSKRAVQMFRALAESDPGNVGDAARISLFDILLFQDLDLERAKDALAEIKREATGNLAAPTRNAQPLPPTELWAKQLNDADIGASVRWRQLLVSYLNGDKAAIAEHAVSSFGRPTAGTWQVLASIDARGGLGSSVNADDTVTFWPVRLVDLYLCANEFESARDTAQRILKSTRTIAVRDKSALQMRIARSITGAYAARKPVGAQLADGIAAYLEAQRIAPDAPWAAEALFFAGNVRWNSVQDGAFAVKVWSDMLRQYPQCRFAEQAGYTIGVLHQLDGHIDDAKRAFAAFKESWPESALNDNIGVDGLDKRFSGAVQAPAPSPKK